MLWIRVSEVLVIDLSAGEMNNLRFLLDLKAPVGVCILIVPPLPRGHCLASHLNLGFLREKNLDGNPALWGEVNGLMDSQELDT